MSKNWILVVLLVGLIGLMFFLSRSGIVTKKANTVTTDTTQNPATAVLDRNIDINDVIIDAPVYSDLTLTLEGRINDWVTKNVFTITPIKSGFASSGKSLPIINRDNYKLPDDTPKSIVALGEVANIKVTGKIVIFDRATVEQQWGIDLNDKELDHWNKTPVMLVDRIEKL